MAYIGAPHLVEPEEVEAEYASEGGTSAQIVST